MMNGQFLKRCCLLVELKRKKVVDIHHKYTNGTAERYRSYLGTAQSIGLPERTRWCQSERDCGRMPHRSRLFNVHFEPYGRKRPDRKKNAQWKPSYFSYFYDRIRKKNQKLVEEAFKKIEKTALNGISEEEQKQFMDIFCRIYRNLADMK